MLDAEIVSSDAYQVYRELPILTAAPSPADRERVPHHMVSIIPVQKNWNTTEHYHRAMRWWFGLGWPAFAAVLAIVWLMVAKPAV